MPDATYSLEEASERAIKMAAYYGKVLEKYKEGFIAAEIDGVTIIVARGKHGRELQHLLEVDNYFGKDVKISRKQASEGGS